MDFGRRGACCRRPSRGTGRKRPTDRADAAAAAGADGADPRRPEPSCPCPSVRRRPCAAEVRRAASVADAASRGSDGADGGVKGDPVVREYRNRASVQSKITRLNKTEQCL